MGYETGGGTSGWEFLEEVRPETLAETAAGRALRALFAVRIRGGRMPVVLSSEAGGTMVHEAIGHGLEADLARRGLSVYRDSLGKTVGSPLVTIVDDATITGNGPEALRIIDRVGSDLGFGLGTFGKEGQGVPVGDAQPTLRFGPPFLTVG